ncbi:unnamed protein product [Durusdinium trenchii]|uniref:Uncharacterized protein n=1 Tax=Durusdinium trenchii TaxID=1381693 RepID=A0ABP0IAE4_9DINO
MEQCMRQVWAHLDRALLEGKQENPRWSVASCFGTIDPTQYMMSVLGLGQELKLRGCQVHGRLEMSSMPCPLIAKRVRYHAGSPSSKVTFQSVFAAGTSKCDALVGSFGDHDMAALAALGSSEFCPDFLLLDLNLSPKKGRDFEEIFRSNFPGYKQVFLVLKKYSAPESKVHASDERTLFAASCRSVPDLPEPLELAWTKGIRVLNDVLAPKVPSLLQCLLDQKSATWKYEMEAMRQHTGGKRKRDVENEKASSAQDHGDDNGPSHWQTAFKHKWLPSEHPEAVPGLEGLPSQSHLIHVHAAVLARRSAKSDVPLLADATAQNWKSHHVAEGCLPPL